MGKRRAERGKDRRRLPAEAQPAFPLSSWKPPGGEPGGGAGRGRGQPWAPHWLPGGALGIKPRTKGPDP